VIGTLEDQVTQTASKKNRILHLYGLMDGTDDVLDGDLDVVVRVDEFGPLNLQPHPGGSG